jgi:asparagine synthase (glutamine-hydrolysing)
VRWSYIDELSQAGRHLDTLQRLEIEHTQLPHLLKYEDKNSMAHAVESRLPFLDYRVVETALSLPHRWKVHQGWSKFILRKVGEGLLPPEITWRRAKIGFEAPSQWLEVLRRDVSGQAAASPLLRQLCRPGVLDRPQILGWRPLFLAAWERQFEVELP